MTSTDSSIVQLIALAGQGDTQAQQQIWDQYFPQLVRLAQQRLKEKFHRVGDGEDVALSVLNSFFHQIQKISLPEVRGRDDLWRFLSRMTQHKAIDWIRFQQRHRRRVLGESAIGLGNAGSSRESAAEARPMADVASPGLEPQLAVMLIENCERLMDQLPAELRPIVLLRLAGHTNAEIAVNQDCSLATVERRLKLVRSIWSQTLQEKEQS